MMSAIQNREFSGRAFTEEEISLIKEITVTYPKLSQAELANTICELISWTQANGKPKTVQCMHFLRSLANDGELVLPTLNERMGMGRNRGVINETDGDVSWIDM
jgi:archaellum biogenesis ATPase FlaH